MEDHQLGTLLARWHQWRHHWSHERGLSRVRFSSASEMDDDDYERMVMMGIEEVIASLPRDEQLALQHVARAECLGVEVMFNPHLLANKDQRETLVQKALHELHRKLLHRGLV